MKDQPTKRIVHKSSPLLGRATVPGDKSITHRALFFAGMTQGITTIDSPSPAHDCLNTLDLLRTLGCHCEKEENRWVIESSTRTERATEVMIDCGNSGTTARLAAGFLTGERGHFILKGDTSLSSRPMERVAFPLRMLGASVQTTSGNLPLSVIAKSPISGLEKGIESIEVSSAQVHASLALAGFRSEKGVRLLRIAPMRDHTLRMARKLGWTVETDGRLDRIYPATEGANRTSEEVGIGSSGQNVNLSIPGDISSAAFLITAALLVPGSDLLIHNVGLNPTRIAFLECMQAMGGELSWKITDDGWEPRGEIQVRYSPNLHGIGLNKESGITPAMMIDELPLLSLLGSQAQGTTTIRDAAELRFKESDRISATVGIMRSLGIEIEELKDGFAVSGGQAIRGGVSVDHQGDHRLAMLAGVAGLIADEPIIIPVSNVVNVSWPGFWQAIQKKLLK